MRSLGYSLCSTIQIIKLNACVSISEMQALLLSVFFQSKNPQDYPTTPNSSLLTPNSSFVLPLLEAVCQFQQQLFRSEAAEEQPYLHH